jgi:hypothetical protein
MKIKLFTLLLLIFLAGCGHQDNHESEIEHGTWLKGDKEFFVETIEEQFGGFSTTMREVAYRFEELYWAGLDGNWEYADYQLEHIEEAIEAGVIRRPERSLNTELFLKGDQARMQLIVDDKDAAGFEVGFNAYRQACVACHMREEVSFIPVNIPIIRQGITWSD